MPSTTDVQTANWILTGAAIVFTTGRLAIRFSNNRRLRSDDWTHLLALILLIIHGATNQVTLAAKAKQKVDIASHQTTELLLEEYRHLHDLNTVNNVFLYAIMWAVKIAFLLLYRQVFKLHKSFLYVWWGVLAFAVLSYIPPFAMVVHTCAGASTLQEYRACNSGTSFRTAKLITTCVLNVVSDVMIMALPLWMLGQLQMSLRNKIGLALVFCVALFCVALDILRTAEAVAENQALYTVIEVNFTVIVFCLPTYRRLLLDNRALSKFRSSFGSKNVQSDRSTDSLEDTKRRSSAKTADTMVEDEYDMLDKPKNVRLSTYEAHPLTDIESQEEIAGVSHDEQSPEDTLGRPR